MRELSLPLQFLAARIGTWLARRQERLIEYLKEENAVLIEKLGGKVWLTDAERRRLARLAKLIGRKALGRIANVATPGTMLGRVEGGPLMTSSAKLAETWPEVVRASFSVTRAAARVMSLSPCVRSELVAPQRLRRRRVAIRPAEPSSSRLPTGELRPPASQLQAPPAR
jgi:hypothetical protein